MKLVACFAAVLLLAACARDASDSADTSGATTAAASPATTSPAQAAAISNALAANPASADSILRANGHTAESFEQLLFRIAADSASAATYAAAKTP